MSKASKMPLWQLVPNKLEKLYMMVDPKAIEEVEDIKLESLKPLYVKIMCTPKIFWTREETDFMHKYSYNIEKLSTFNSTSFLVDKKVLPANWTINVTNLKKRLEDLNIEFILAGIGGAGMNAWEVLKHLDPKVYEADTLTLFDNIRMSNSLFYKGKKLDCISSGSKHNKFLEVGDLNPYKKYIIYSSVEDPTLKNTLSDLPNVLQINVGFTGNRGGATFNAYQPITTAGYGMTDVTVLKVNATLLAYRVVMALLEMSDEELLSKFTVQDEDIVNINVTEEGILPDLTPYKLPTAIDYPKGFHAGAVPFEKKYGDIYNITLQEVSTKLLEDLGNLSFSVPIIPISEEGVELVAEMEVPINREDSEDYDWTNRYFTFSDVDLDVDACQASTGTIHELIATAYQLHIEYPFSFMGGTILSPKGSINLLHPFFMEELLKNEDVVHEVVWWFLESYDTSTPYTVQTEEQFATILNCMVDLKENYTVPMDKGSGKVFLSNKVIEIEEKFSTKNLILPLGTMILKGAYEVPWYGYMLVSRGEDIPYVKVLGDFGTPQLGDPQRYGFHPTEGLYATTGESDLCTGAYNSSAFGAILRTHRGNNSNGYGRPQAFPEDLRGAYNVAVEMSLQYYTYLIEDKQNG